MRMGNVRSAIVIISRGLPDVSCSLFVRIGEYALSAPGGVNPKICREAAITDRLWLLIAYGVPSISFHMTRNREDRSSNEKAPRRREEVKSR